VNNTTPTTPPTPRRDLEAGLSRLLSICVLLAATVGLIGIALYLPAHRGTRADLSTFTPQPDHLRQPTQILEHAATLDPTAILQLAVVLLILTPILRVIFSLAMFATKRDWLYVTITLVVLCALAAGLFVK